jgi:hypothetical protein
MFGAPLAPAHDPVPQGPQSMFDKVVGGGTAAVLGQL